ncbi:hypothetical protein NQ317_018243 [Molorchus minor]|uniref:Uncharacterized protein n=1 Tax=Molorchus minor TaxID=1323400 RepID=A0ABQ9K4Y1_9CUCU|nr:hypothetical protein NQ317_018243 [Molorchus minor]
MPQKLNLRDAERRFTASQRSSGIVNMSQTPTELPLTWYKMLSLVTHPNTNCDHRCLTVLIGLEATKSLDHSKMSNPRCKGLARDRVRYYTAQIVLENVSPDSYDKVPDVLLPPEAVALPQVHVETRPVFAAFHRLHQFVHGRRLKVPLVGGEETAGVQGVVEFPAYLKHPEMYVGLFKRYFRIDRHTYIGFCPVQQRYRSNRADGSVW